MSISTQNIPTFPSTPPADLLTSLLQDSAGSELSGISATTILQPDRSDLSVRLLQPSGASRLSAFDVDGKPRAQHVSAKASTSLLLDPETQRVLGAESTIESKAFVAFAADRSVAFIQDQPPAISYFDADGVERTHTFDFQVTLKSGESFAVFARNKERAERPETRKLIQILADQLPTDFASEIIVVTEEDFPAWLVANNTLLVSVRTDPRTHIDDLVHDAALKLEHPITIGDLASEHGGGAVAFRPIVRLIDDGILELVEPAHINGRCMVRRAAQGVA